MKLHFENELGQYSIQSYDKDFIQVNAQKLTQPFVLTAGSLVADWPAVDIQSLSAEAFELLTDNNPELIILGTGARLIQPKMEILAIAYRKQIGVEIMDTGAACRTYNILLAEDRKLAAGFFF